MKSNNNKIQPRPSIEIKHIRLALQSDIKYCKMNKDIQVEKFIPENRKNWPINS